MAPVTKRRIIFSIGSTRSMLMGLRLNAKKSRKKMGASLLSTIEVNSLNFL